MFSLFFFFLIRLSLSHFFSFRRAWRSESMSSEFLIGISKGLATGYKGVDGSDLSTAKWVRTNDEPQIKTNLCAVLDVSLGHFQFQPVSCEVPKNFVCEYRARPQPEKVSSRQGNLPVFGGYNYRPLFSY